jgi:ribosomal-protein-serine acetyltransferase
VRLAVSETLELRSLRVADAQAVYDLVESDREHLNPWMPWAADQTRAGTELFIRSAAEQERRGTGFQTGIFIEGAVAGVAGFHRIDHDNASASVGYWLARTWEGRGLMSQAIAALLDYGFGELNLHRVELRAAPANERSRAVAARLGFTEEGLLREAERFGASDYRDLLVFSLLSPQWRRAPRESGGSPPASRS